MEDNSKERDMVKVNFEIPASTRNDVHKIAAIEDRPKDWKKVMAELMQLGADIKLNKNAQAA